jgi:hypothetical protein
MIENRSDAMSVSVFFARIAAGFGVSKMRLFVNERVLICKVCFVLLEVWRSPSYRSNGLHGSAASDLANQIWS